MRILLFLGLFVQLIPWNRRDSRNRRNSREDKDQNKKEKVMRSLKVNYNITKTKWRHIRIRRYGFASSSPISLQSPVFSTVQHSLPSILRNIFSLSTTFLVISYRLSCTDLLRRFTLYVLNCFHSLTRKVKGHFTTLICTLGCRECETKVREKETV